MITASQLRSGMAIRYEGQPYKIVAAEYHPGQGKMGGTTHTRLKNLDTGTIWEHSFRAELKVEELSVEKHSMDFLYRDSGQCCFMNPDTFEQIEIPETVIGQPAPLLTPEMRLTVEFVEGRPISVLFPDVVEVRVTDTAPPIHQQQDSNFKTALLENGLEVLVPQFIKTGDAIRLDVQNLKYIERAKGSAK